MISESFQNLLVWYHSQYQWLEISCIIMISCSATFQMNTASVTVMALPGRAGQGAWWLGSHELGRDITGRARSRDTNLSNEAAIVCFGRTPGRRIVGPASHLSSRMVGAFPGVLPEAHYRSFIRKTSAKWGVHIMHIYDGGFLLVILCILFYIFCILCIWVLDIRRNCQELLIKSYNCHILFHILHIDIFVISYILLYIFYILFVI